MGCLCFSISKHLTTRPCLRIAFFLQLHGCVFPFWFMTHFEFRFEVKLMTSGLGIGRKHLSTIDSQVWELNLTSPLPSSNRGASVLNSCWNGTWSHGTACLMCLFLFWRPFFLANFPLHWLQPAWRSVATTGRLRRSPAEDTYWKRNCSPRVQTSPFLHARTSRARGPQSTIRVCHKLP